MNKFSFLPFQNLASERLLLRQIKETDVQEIFGLRSDADVMKYVPRPLCKNTDEAMGHIKMINQKIETNEGINWAITLNGNDTLIGIIGHYRISWENFRSEIGYMLSPKYAGQGITTEAVKLMILYGFEQMGMHSLEGVIDPHNIASAKVLEKNGFVKEAHLKENEFFSGKFLDTVIYSLVNNK